MSKDVPAIPRPLLEYLQRAFPNTLPLNPVSLEELGFLRGNQAVIHHLMHHFEKQKAAVLQPT